MSGSSGIDQLFAYPFMVHALEAGSIAAILAAVVGWYMVLRRQSFAGHTLALMAFPGAAGAALAGIPASLGYYISSTAAGAVIGGARGPGRARATETATIAAVQTAGLALGFLFLSLSHQVLGGTETLLFGTFLGIGVSQVLVLLGVAIASILALSMIARPLLFSTIDLQTAQARGVPVRLLDRCFILILAAAVAATSQITGALLVFSLLVAPAAAAQQITMRPLAGLLTSVALALVIVWVSLGAAYFSIYPVGFYVTSLGLCAYVVARAASSLARRRGRCSPTSS